MGLMNGETVKVEIENVDSVKIEPHHDHVAVILEIEKGLHIEGARSAIEKAAGFPPNEGERAWEIMANEAIGSDSLSHTRLA